MSEQKIITDGPFVDLIDGEPYQFRNKWEKTSIEKVSAMYKILEGLNVRQAKGILEDLSNAIDKNAVLS